MLWSCHHIKCTLNPRFYNLGNLLLLLFFKEMYQAQIIKLFDRMDLETVDNYNGHEVYPNIVGIQMNFFTFRFCELPISD